MLKADLHLHSVYSGDSNCLLEDIVRQAIAVGVNCLALTDHNSIEGAAKLKEMAPFTVIVGEEIRTSQGEIIGLFLTEKIPPDLTPAETVKRIKAQGGLVLIPHPFDRYFRPSAIKLDALESIVKDVDIIEVFNSHTVFPGDSARAYRFAKKHRLLGSAGSDAHTIIEIGSSYIEMPEFTDAEGFKRSLMKATINGHITNPFHRLVSVMVKLSKKIRKRLCSR